MDKLRWMPEEEAESTIVASDYQCQPQGVDSEGSSYNAHANMSGDGACDDGLIDGSMDNDQEDQPPLGSDDEEQVLLLNLLCNLHIVRGVFRFFKFNFRKIQKITEEVVTTL